MRIAQITDLHLDDFLADHYRVDTRGNFDQVLADVRRRGIVDVVLTGDLGEFSSQPWLVETLARHGVRPVLILGNHDHLEHFRALSLTAADCRPDGLYFERTLEGVQTFFLDSSSGAVGETQLTWLSARLKQGAGTAVVFVHHPVLDCGGTTADRLYALANRDAVHQALAASGRDVTLFCGHYHYAGGDTRTVGRVTQHLTPSTLVQFQRTGDTVSLDTRQIGYRLIELSDHPSTEVVMLLL